jgi:poly-gamma-glutamate synthesis protein (capsule biosynthesis protein)
MPNARDQIANSQKVLTLFLCGDVMTGRGIDQILPHPVDPRLYESYVKDASHYVTIAERQSGDIQRPVQPDYIWGEALNVLSDIAPDVRIANLETSITTNDDFWPGKGVHYRMSPENIDCLETAGFDCCILANNHVLDWGYAGLDETITTLAKAGIQTAGAGRDIDVASAPARLQAPGKGDVLVFGLADPSSGVPREWLAGKGRAGVNLLQDLSPHSARSVAEQILERRHGADIVVVSIHWGPNWGHNIPDAQVAFAHELIDRGAADIVHGHSSHHPKAVEIYRHKPIIYGCGDFITDYEGIGGYEEYRPWLSLTYFVTMNLDSGLISAMDIIPLRIERMRLVQSNAEERQWLVEKMNEVGDAFPNRFMITDHCLTWIESTGASEGICTCMQ